MIICYIKYLVVNYIGVLLWTLGKVIVDLQVFLVTCNPRLPFPLALAGTHRKDVRVFI